MRPAKPLEEHEVQRSAGLHAVPPRPAAHNAQWRKLLWIGGLVVVTILVAAVVLFAWKWPFTPDHVRTDLEQGSGTKVSFQNFRQTFFPPGCVLEHVTLRSGADPNRPPLLTVEKLTVATSYARLLAHDISTIRADGAHVVLPPFGNGQKLFQGSSNNHQTTIGELIADASIFDVSSATPGAPPLRFQVRKLTVHDLGSSGGMSFQIDTVIPKLPGEVIATAKLGHWNAEKPEMTELSGRYQFRHAQLGVLHAIAGTLASEGRFQGPVKNLSVRGSTDVPDFEVTRTHHKIHLITQFDAMVDATAGDVVLRSIQAHSGPTTVTGNGKIAGTPGKKGKTASLNLFVREGRVEDVMFLFVRAPQPPLDGPMSLEARVTIPPGKKKFLEKLVMEGSFTINSAHFTSTGTQEKVNKLSAQARGEKNPDAAEAVLTDWRGQVLVNGGVAHFSDLFLSTPGARARFRGTYGLEDQRVNLDGMLYLDVKLSQTTKGIKAILIKPIEPFLKKNRRGGAKIPVKVTGTYLHPSYDLDPI